jgi:hypothetical protein
MKTVFSNNSEVVHVWAQRTHFNGRNQSGSLFFYGDKIYSYGYHYLLGEFISNKNNDVAVIINTDYYSATTAKHSSLAWGATTHYTQFEKKYTEEKNVISLLNELEVKLLRARKPLIYIKEAEETINNYVEYLKFMHGIAVLSESVLKAFKPFKLEDEELETLRDKDKERCKKAVQKEKERLAIEIKDFLNYEKDFINSNEISEAYVRISKDGENIETSKGVKVSIRKAKILYSKIVRGEDIKGFKIGYHRVIGINGCLKIGCHDINLKNMHEVGKQLLSMDIAPEITA